MNDKKTEVLSLFDGLAQRIEDRFQAGRRVLSFQEYLGLFAENPVRLGRDAAGYVRDMFDHYGTQEVSAPWGKSLRYRLFDLPWETSTEARESRLIGHEEIQGTIYRSLSNFVKEGRSARLLLMHGPNGSAKSTTAGCILRALENYSALDEGAVYRFHWVFPSHKTTRGTIGFGGAKSASDEASFAHLTDEEIDARLVVEIRDHPLFLIPREERKALLDAAFAPLGKAPPPYLLHGRLCHKNQQVFEALMMAEGGSLARTLRHVQVERYFMSRRYRVGAVTLGPELSIDAGERQITADRSLSALPTALQATTLFEAHGELVEAAGGVLEFSDLLKRPLDTFRYLQLTLETGEVALPHQTLETNVVMLGSANEVHLTAFRDHPEFPSFRGRFELVSVPYLMSYLDEERIYLSQIAPYVGKHVAPYAIVVAAEFAVLTRLFKPKYDAYTGDLVAIVKQLTVEQKLDLYGKGLVPESLDADARKVLRAGIEQVYRETEANVEYEGSLGASARAMRTVVLNAAQSREYACLSPFAVLQEIDELCKQTSEYDWLRVKSEALGYHDTKEMRAIVRRRLLDRIEEDMRRASGLVDETKYAELFDKYVMHVSVWVKGESIRNSITGEYEKADERLMREVEGFLGVTATTEDHRKGLISSVAAWAIDHPGQRAYNAVVFPHLLQKMKDAVFVERRKPVALLVRDLVAELYDKKELETEIAAGINVAPKGADLSDARRTEVREVLTRLKALGYDDDSAFDAASAIWRMRLADLVA